MLFLSENLSTGVGLFILVNQVVTNAELVHNTVQRDRPSDSEISSRPTVFVDTLADGSACNFCPEMVALVAGEFDMGSSKGEQGRVTWEHRKHRVRISKPFAIGRFEVKFSEWDACVANGGCGDSRPYDGGWGRGRRPVINVTWDDAVAYTRWLSEKTGKKYRLLSEAEWEYAARAGTITRFSYGDDPRYARLCQHGNHADRSIVFSGSNKNCSDGVGEKTAEVGSYESNNWGLYDMHGNVSEWVADCWHKGVNSISTNGATRHTRNCRKRVFRGGSWLGPPRTLRSAYRSGINHHIRSNGRGFRIARTL